MPSGGFGLDVLLQIWGNLSMGTSAFDQIGAVPGWLGLRGIILRAGQHHQLEITLAAAAAHQQPHPNWGTGRLLGCLLQYLDRLFQRHILHIVFIQFIDDLGCCHSIPCKADQHVAVQLAHFGQCIRQHLDFAVCDWFFHHAAIADHGTERRTTYCKNCAHVIVPSCSAGLSAVYLSVSYHSFAPMGRAAHQKAQKPKSPKAQKRHKPKACAACISQICRITCSPSSCHRRG